MVDQLAIEYVDRPVVFLEYSLYGGFNTRYSRWWAAYGGGVAYVPLVMVDSGNQISNGYVNFYNVYKGMVETSLSRPPQAELEASVWRDGSKVGFYVFVKNLTNVTLNYSTNGAAIHGIIYEDIHEGVTNRYVRSAVEAEITSLAPGNSDTFIFETSDITVVNGNNIHAIVLVDFRPSGATGKYDMLQAAKADFIYSPFDVLPSPVSFAIDQDNPQDQSRALKVLSANFVHWSATNSIPWVTITPESGPIDTQPIVSVTAAMLSTGMQEGTITFTTGDSLFSKDITVKAYFGHVTHTYMPILKR